MLKYKMKRNSKAAIMIVLMILSILVWIPKNRKITGVSSTDTSVTYDQAISVAVEIPRKRTEFVDWGRNPFVWPQMEETGGISNLRLMCIMVTDKGTYAAINESIVRVGDKIIDKTVKRIEENKVILTDGTKDYVLDLK